MPARFCLAVAFAVLFAVATTLGAAEPANAKPAQSPAAKKAPQEKPPTVFIPEMERIAEIEAIERAPRWSDADKAQIAKETGQAVAEWKQLVPDVAKELTPERVRTLSRWARPQMEGYKTVPPLDKTPVQPIGTDAQRKTLVLEGVIDTLPSHHQLVTRWLKVYVVYSLSNHAITKIIITIRGERLE
jgi:hypothetical protein